eukprot:641410-Rhodomonas_salina.1
MSLLRDVRYSPSASCYALSGTKPTYHATFCLGHPGTSATACAYSADGHELATAGISLRTPYAMP